MVIGADTHATHRKRVCLNFEDFFERFIAENLDATSLVLFRYACKNGSPVVHQYDLREVDLLLVVQRDGVFHL